MIFKVKNLGQLKEAEVDLNKDLILLMGQNNTGKTYLAYAIYGFLEKNIIWSGITLGVGGEIQTENVIKVDLRSSAKNYYEKQKYNLVYQHYDFFQTDYYTMQGVETSCKPPNIEFIKHKLYESTHEDVKNFGIAADFIKPKKSYELSIDITFPRKHGDVSLMEIGSYHWRFIEKIMFPSENILFFPAERTAINLFSKEIAINESGFLKFSLKMSNGLRSEFLDFLKNKVNRYPKPIQDSLKTAEDLLRISKHRQSEYSHLADELEKEILGGKISVSEYGDLRFKPENSEISPLETHLTGSMIKSLAGISFYLRHLAQKHDCIIIDEPEINLHPDNQRKIARFFGRLINEGFKVIISTHSDYIIKEINNLVMLSKESEAQKELLKKYKYAENELIKPERIEALLFRKLDGNEQITPNKIEVSETGLSVQTIDEVIDELDNTAERIYFQLFENQ